MPAWMIADQPEHDRQNPWNRKAERFAVVLPARCQLASGFTDRVVVTDISLSGCQIASQAMTLRPGDPVFVRPQVLEGLCGTVRWVRGHTAGIAFDRPLYAPVVDHLHKHHRTFLSEANGNGRSRRLAA